MRKFILTLAFFSMSLLVTLSVVAPNSTPMWIASTATPFIIIRVCIMAILFALLTTNPPRSPYFRFMVGAIAVFLSGWVLSVDTMKILDTISILGCSAAMGITVLEYNPKTDQLLTHTSKHTASIA